MITLSNMFLHLSVKGSTECMNLLPVDVSFCRMECEVKCQQMRPVVHRLLNKTPDVFSQTLLAIPMYCLCEIGVFFSRFYVGKGRNREEENDAEAESEKTEE